MTDTAARISVTETSTIMKYAEGATPGIDEPIEVVTVPVVLYDQEAIDYLLKLGYTMEQIKNIKGEC
jgi:hypothetical protein